MNTEINLPKNYAPSEFEDRIYAGWCEKGYFTPERDPEKKPFTIVIPPPNVTGQLHMGHALDETLQDILIRYKRMQGFSALWVPGTDHAGIATQIKVEEDLPQERRSHPLRPRTREVPRARLGLEKTVRRPHHLPAQKARLLLRLDPREIHDGRGLLEGGQGGFRQPL